MRFSYRYQKMPMDFSGTRLLEVFVVDGKEQLSWGFLNYDTVTLEGKHYLLPDGKLIVLLLITKNHLWTTIRTWNEGKEKYYREMRGKQINIFLEEVNR